ncbi:MAG: endopeptidase La [Pseudomonadota bacterium]
MTDNPRDETTADGEFIVEAEIITEPGQALVLPADALPARLFILPQSHRPFFPGQAMPLVLDAETWAPMIRALQEAEQDVVGLVLAREHAKGPESRMTPEDLFEVGCACRIHRVQHSDDQIHVLLEGLQRFRISQWLNRRLPLRAGVRYLHDATDARDSEVKAYAVAIINIIKELIPLNPLYGEELKAFLSRFNPNEPAALADFATALTSADKADLQAVLETPALLARLEKVVTLLHKELEIARAQMDIREQVENEIRGHQRKAFLRQQLKFIQKELGLEKDDKTNDIDTFRERLDALDLPDAVQQRAEEDLAKLALLEPGSPEYGVVRNYLDWLSRLPWGVVNEDNQDLVAAAKALDAHHEGLDDVKERILEFLGVGIQRGEAGGSIVCFVGPPGVGKTSLGRAIAAALGREFFRFSVGGMRDEAEIKGHRRTYVGALPGKLISALKSTGVSNPVIMLDEIDKIGVTYQGDPAAALLEVLDPEQNDSFTDHYLELPFDLSRVLFICTANQLDTIPGPLLDRMEVVHLAGYLAKEKLAIARKHLLPRQLERAGLRKRGDVSIEAAALRLIVEDYAREAGVRRLDRHLATIVRKAVLKKLRGADAPIKVTKDDVADYLGPPPFKTEAVESGVGVVTGLAWTAMGGATLPVEATISHRRGAGLKLTGQLGDVMQESASIAYSYVIGNAQAFGIEPAFFDDAFIHLHVPAGATPKDGPSAGITMASALISLALGKPPRKNVAMTGELTLTGRVYPIGGVQEKLLAARRVGVKRVLLPEANRGEYEEVPEHIRQGITIDFVSDYAEVAELLF